ncbi:MAG: DUF192 domain-containing protein [bacterium]
MKILLIICLLLSGCSMVQPQVIINDHIIKIEIADTDEQHYNGLSNREEICKTCGMLFVFSEKTEPEFVMRNMNFPLDIIWINNEKIVKIDNDLSVEGAEPANKYSPGQPVDYVLEVNAGLAEEFGFSIGDNVIIIL